MFKHCLGLLVSAGIVKKARGRIEQKEKFDLALNLEDREICSMRWNSLSSWRDFARKCFLQRRIVLRWKEPPPTQANMLHCSRGVGWVGWGSRRAETVPQVTNSSDWLNESLRDLLLPQIMENMHLLRFPCGGFSKVLFFFVKEKETLEIQCSYQALFWTLRWQVQQCSTLSIRCGLAHWRPVSKSTYENVPTRPMQANGLVVYCLQ